MFIDVSSLGAVEPVCDYKEKRNNPEIIALSGQSATKVDGWLLTIDGLGGVPLLRLTKLKVHDVHDIVKKY